MLDIPLRNATQSLQQQQQQQQLISPITGQPLSHVPAPLLLSSSTHSTIAGTGTGGGSTFRLARSSTQPLQSPRVAHLAGTQGAGTPPSSITRQHSGSDSGSFSEQLTLSVGNDTERIFAMSGVDDDSAIQSLGDDPTAGGAGAGAAAAGTPPSSGLARSNSVRARANMFQQLQQEQTRNRREPAGASRQGECESSGRK